MLTKTTSPLAARKTALPQAVTVSRENDSFKLMFIDNWHEGEFVLVRSDGSLTWEGTANGRSIDIIDPCHIRLSSHKISLDYVPVDNEEQFIANVVLVGIYADKNGAVYEFRRDGVAQFPDKEFHYSIGLDQVIDAYDYIENKDDSNERIASRRIEDELILYPIYL